jgi:WD40 repeat protein
MQGMADARRRYIIAAGTGFYDDPKLPDLRGVRADVDAITEVFTSRGYEQVLVEAAADPTAEEFIELLEDWLHRPDRDPDDIVIVYYAGHAINHFGVHLLQFHNSRDLRFSHALPTAQLARILRASPVRNVLVILDTCYAQAGTSEFAEIAHDLSKSYPTDGTGQWLLAVARTGDVAWDGAFVSALQFGLARCPAGDRQPYQDFPGVVDNINTYFLDHFPHQQASYSVVNATEPPPFFPNPGYLPFLPAEPLDIESQRRIASAMDRHFGPRGRGVEAAAEKGMYFTGRKRVLAELASWLTASHDEKILVITGQPGSGKSAVLGRLITLAERESSAERAEASPETVPPVGAIDLPIHAHGASLADIMVLVGAAIGSRSATTEDVLEDVRTSRRRLTIVIDALDEAGAANDQREASRIADELLRPLAEVAGVRFIIGTRSDPIKALGPSVRIVDLDSPLYYRAEDISDYVRQLLLTGMSGNVSPYSGRSPLAATVAYGVAEKAANSFLVARMVARALTQSSSVIDISDPDWIKRLPSGTGEAFDRYLARYGDREALVRRIIAPLAYAARPGLPWDHIWARVAAAISGFGCSDEDIKWVLDNASSYIVEVPLAHNRSVFRLFHEALAEHLREPHQQRRIHGLIADTLIASVPDAAEGGRDWQAAHPYVRERLATHAAIGSRLDHLLTDPGFLTHASPATLLPALQGVTTISAAVASCVYRASVHEHERLLPSQRRHILAIDAHRFRVGALARKLSDALPWRPQWCTGSQVSTALLATLGGGGVPLRGVECTIVDNRPVALACGDDGTVRIWDLTTARERATLSGHRGPVLAVACTLVDGQPMAVTGGNGARIWNLETLQGQITRTGHAGQVRAVAFAVLDGFPVAITGASDGWVRIFRAISCTKKASWSGHDGKVNAIVSITSDRGVILLTGDANGVVHVWDPRAGRIRATLSGHTDAISGIACTQLEGRPVVITVSVDGTTRIWRLEPLQIQFVRPGPGHSGDVNAVAYAKAGSKAVVVTGSSDGTVRLWDRVTGRSMAVLASRDLHKICSLVCTIAGDHSIVVAGCRDRGVPGTHRNRLRLWDMGQLSQIDMSKIALIGKPVKAHAGSISAITSLTHEGRLLAITGSDDATIRVWDLIGGHQLLVIRTGGPVYAVACSILHGRPVIVAGGSDAGLQIWDLLDACRLETLSGHLQRINAISCGQLDGRPIAISGSSDHTLRVWDLARRSELCMLTGHAGPVSAATYAVLDDLPIAVSGGDDRTIRTWDLSTMREYGEALFTPLPVCALSLSDAGELVAALGWEVLLLQRPPSVARANNTLRIQ